MQTGLTAECFVVLWQCDLYQNLRTNDHLLNWYFDCLYLRILD